MKNENGQEKSAILKGQTLVNIIKSIENSQYQAIDYNLSFTDNTKSYYVKFDSSFSVSEMGLLESNTAWNVNKGSIHSTNGYVILTPDKNKAIYGLRLRFDANKDTTYIPSVNIVCIEYQEGMENWDIPYFEGMKSVQMPVLTTTGKNVFDLTNSGLQAESAYDKSLNVYGFWTFIVQLEPNKEVTVSRKNTNGYNLGVHLKINNENVHTSGYWFVASHGENENKKSITLTTGSDGCIYLLFPNSIERVNKVLDICEYIQIEYGSTATPYEPHKSNILTVNEEVELRGVGDIKDTLNCNTGEYIKRINSIILEENGKITLYSGQIQENTLAFRFSNLNINPKWVGTGTKPNLLCTTFPTTTYNESLTSNFEDKEGICLDTSNGESTNAIVIRVLKSRLISEDVAGIRDFISKTKIDIVSEAESPVVKTVDITITDQDNQPQERMKLFPNGYINTSSSTFPPILELKGITHNNKLNMTTTNGTNNTQLNTLDNLVLDGIICRDGTVVRDSYDVESGLYTKRVFRFTVDEEFIERYRGKWQYGSNDVVFEFFIKQNITGLPNSLSNTTGIANNMTYRSSGNVNRVNVRDGATVYITILKEELKSYDVDGLLDWIKRNGAIEIAYQMATPQIIHIQPNMTPYVSTRP